MNQVECGRNAVWGGCEKCLINSHFQSEHKVVDAQPAMKNAFVPSVSNTNSSCPSYIGHKA